MYIVDPVLQLYKISLQFPPTAFIITLYLLRLYTTTTTVHSVQLDPSALGTGVVFSGADALFWKIVAS